MTTDTQTPRLSNGPAAAAILSAAVGCLAIGVLQCIADISPTVSKMLVFYKGSGALSGETTAAIVLWLALWFGLNRIWRLKTVNLGTINLTSFALLILGLTLTFPPLIDALK